MTRQGSCCSRPGESASPTLALCRRCSPNTSLRTNDELITEQLRLDPAFRAEWEHTALGRATAVATVNYRAEHDLSQQELAGLLGMTTAQITELEVGDATPNADTLHAISAGEPVSPRGRVRLPRAFRRVLRWHATALRRCPG